MKKTDKLKRVQTAVDYTLRTPDVQKALHQVGFSKADVLEGKAMLGKVEMLDAAQQKEYGDRSQAAYELEQARQRAWDLYIHHLEGARFALKNHPGHWKTLELSGTRKRDLFGWLDQARKFYSNAYQAKDILKRYQLTDDELQQGQSMVEAVTEAYNVRQKETNEAQAATQQRNEALRDLEAWMTRFAKSARLAFANDPQTLKGLGLVNKVTAS